MQVQTQTRTLIYYETPYRILQAVLDCIKVFGLMRPVVIARELTNNMKPSTPLGQLYQWLVTNRRMGRNRMIQGAEPSHRSEMSHLLNY